MEDDIPTTEHVRAQYARQENYDEYYEGDLYLTPDGQFEAARFDTWLARVKADTWSEGFRAGRSADHNSGWWPPNPHHIERNG